MDVKKGFIAVRWVFAIAFACIPVTGQKEVCDSATQIATEEPKQAARHQSAALMAASKSPEKLWAFLIAPGTSYMDRLAAGHAGAALFPPEFLPRIWAARAELRGIPPVVGQPPCYQFWHHRAGPDGYPSRSLLLGRVVAAKQAEQLSAYPVTGEQRSAAPWEWQVDQAFQVLDGRLSVRFSQNPGDYRRLLDQAWRWKRNDVLDDAVWAGSILYDAPRNADWIRAILRVSAMEIPKMEFEVLARRPVREPTARRTLPVSFSPRETPPVKAVYALSDGHEEDSPHTNALTQTAGIAILQTTTETLVAEAVQLRREPMRSTAILALARWALAERLSPSTRLWFAMQICRLEPEGAPFDLTERQPESGSPGEAEALARFEQWARSNRPRWERDASVEMRQLKRLAAELDVGIR